MLPLLLPAESSSPPRLLSSCDSRWPDACFATPSRVSADVRSRSCIRPGTRRHQPRRRTEASSPRSRPRRSAWTRRPSGTTSDSARDWLPSCCMVESGNLAAWSNQEIWRRALADEHRPRVWEMRLDILLGFAAEGARRRRGSALAPVCGRSYRWMLGPPVMLWLVRLRVCQSGSGGGRRVGLRSGCRPEARSWACSAPAPASSASGSRRASGDLLVGSSSGAVRSSASGSASGRFIARRAS